jgi:cytochrome P450
MIDVLSPAFRADPYPYYAELRRQGRAVQVEPGGMWAVPRYDDVLYVLKHPELFSSEGFKLAWQPPWVGYNPLANSMLAMDPPSHARLRALVSRAFGPRAVPRLEQRVRATAAELADALEGEVNVVDALAMPLPAFVISELLGLDHVLRARFKRWSDDLLSVTPQPLDDAHEHRVRATIGELTTFLQEVLAARREAPADDTVSDLLRAESEGQSLTDTEIVSFLVLLLLGGLETTTHLIATTMLFLANHPEHLAALRADPRTTPAFVEEMLRFDGPSQSLPRVTTRDVEVGGVAIPAGSMVLALVASANHDETCFPDPARFDVARGSHGGLQFGHGIHFCIGAALARMEARAALEAVTQRFVRVHRRAEAVQYNRTMTVRGPVALHLRFERD